MGILQNVASMSRVRIFNENLVLLVLFAESRSASTALGEETELMYCCQWWTTLLNAVHPMRGDEPNPGSAVCAFDCSKKILKKDLPEQRNRSPEVHLIFLSQMGKWEFRGDWSHYTLMSPMVGMQRHLNVDKISVYTSEVHVHLTPTKRPFVLVLEDS